jgi:uncharacterized protein YkwD
MLRRHATTVVLSAGAAAAALCLPAPASSADAGPAARAARTPVAVAAASPECRHATDVGVGRRQEHTILCLVNAARRRAGVARLSRNGRLARAAERHARDMTRRDFFQHVTPDGVTPMARARRAGYDASMLAENLAFGTGSWSTPAGTVAQWLDSPGHRRAMLAPGVREIGVGAVSGSPLSDVGGGVTVAAVFARR